MNSAPRGPPSQPPPQIQPTTAPPRPPSFPIAVAIAVSMLIVIIATLLTFIMPEVFFSKAVVRVELDRPLNLDTTKTSIRSDYDPHFIQTEIRVIQSESILTNVIQKLDLSANWGKKYMPGGGAFQTCESLAHLKALLVVRDVPDTGLIEVGVRADNPQEAADLANAVARAYREFRIYERKRLSMGGLDELEKLYSEQSEKVKQAQQAVEALGTASADSEQLKEARRRLDEAVRLRQMLVHWAKRAAFRRSFRTSPLSSEVARPTA